MGNVEMSEFSRNRPCTPKFGSKGTILMEKMNSSAKIEDSYSYIWTSPEIPLTDEASWVIPL